MSEHCEACRKQLYIEMEEVRRQLAAQHEATLLEIKNLVAAAVYQIELSRYQADMASFQVLLVGDGAQMILHGSLEDGFNKEAHQRYSDAHARYYADLERQERELEQRKTVLVADLQTV